MPSQQGSSSSCYQEQFRQPFDEELFHALKDEINKDNEALQRRFPSMETKMDATMIANMGTNVKDLNREMYAIMKRTARQAEEMEKLQKEQSSRHLPSDKKNDDIRKIESIPLSLKDESSNPTLDEDKNIMEFDKMPLVLEGELKELTLVKKNEPVVDEELSMNEKQVEKQHPKLIMEKVLVGVEELYFPIECLNFGMEEDHQVSFLERPSIAKSQVWIDIQHGGNDTPCW